MRSEQEILDVEKAVRERYAAGAREQEAALCCPVDYDRKYLEIIPQEIIERDYGCGDPSKYVREGETVLDLGSGGGKICYIAAQVVGEKGRVIGVDVNEEMLALARKYQHSIGEGLGYHNVDFRRGHIQDLRLNLDLVDAYLRENPVRTASDYARLEGAMQNLRVTQPLIADGSVDVVVSNCVLNLVQESEKERLIGEIFRVLKAGGRIAIADIVSDENVPPHQKNNPELWSGCISGAYREDLFLKAFEDAGFHGISIVKRSERPWQVVEGIEYRSITVVAYKGKQGPCLERNQAVIYKGPWKAVVDDDGHTLFRGERMAVCDKTYRLYTAVNGPYADDIVGVEPRVQIPHDTAVSFDCRKNARRSAWASKGLDYDETKAVAGGVCGPDCC